MEAEISANSFSCQISRISTCLFRKWMEAYESINKLCNMDSYDFLWVYMASYDFLWVHMAPKWLNLTYYGSYGPIWLLMISIHHILEIWYSKLFRRYLRFQKCHRIGSVFKIYLHMSALIWDMSEPCSIFLAREIKQKLRRIFFETPCKCWTLVPISRHNTCMGARS